MCIPRVTCIKLTIHLSPCFPRSPQVNTMKTTHTKNNVDPVDAIESWNLDYHQGCAVECIVLGDLRGAIEHLRREVALYGEGPTGDALSLIRSFVGCEPDHPSDKKADYMSLTPDSNRSATESGWKE